MSDFDQALSVLLGQSAYALAMMFWYTLIFEIPRYGMPLFGAALAPLATAFATGTSTGLTGDIAAAR